MYLFNIDGVADELTEMTTDMAPVSQAFEHND